MIVVRYGHTSSMSNTALPEPFIACCRSVVMLLVCGRSALHFCELQNEQSPCLAQKLEVIAAGGKSRCACAVKSRVKKAQ